MIERDRELLIRLWENGQSGRAIARLLPYKEYLIKREIFELKQKGVLKGHSGRSKEKTIAKVLKAYNDGITDPYSLADMFGLKWSTISAILSHSELNRKRPKHNYKPTILCDKTNQIITEIKGGKPICEIAKTYNVSRQYIYKIKRKYL